MIESIATICKFCVGLSPMFLAAVAGTVDNELDWGKLMGSAGPASALLITGFCIKDRIAMKKAHSAEIDAKDKRHHLELEIRDKKHAAELESARESSRKAWETVERVRKERDSERTKCSDCPGNNIRRKYKYMKKAQ